MSKRADRSAEDGAAWLLLKNISAERSRQPLPTAIRSFERDPDILRCADVLALILASVYADAFYVRGGGETTEDLRWVFMEPPSAGKHSPL